MQVSRHVVVSNRCLCHGLGSHVATGMQLQGSDRVPVAVACQLPRVASSMACSAPLQRAATRQHVLVRTNNTATVAYINHQGGLRSRRLSQLARHLLLWSQKHLRSLRAVSYPWRAQSCSRRALTSACPSGRMATPPRGSPADLETLRGCSGRPVASPDTSHCHLFTPCPRGPSARTRWHTAGLGAYASMRFPK